MDEGTTAPPPPTQEGPVDDGSAATVSSAEDGASGAVEHALPIKITFKASKPADASSGDGEVTAANDEGEEESPATSAAAADTDAGEAVAVGGEAAVDSDDDDGDAVAESKSRKRKIVRDDSDDDDDDDDDDDNNTRNDDDDEELTMSAEPTTEDADADDDADAGESSAAGGGTARAKLMALFGGDSDSDSDDEGFQGFDATEFERAVEEAPVTKGGKKEKGEKKEKKTKKSREHREDRVADSEPAPETDFDKMMLARKNKKGRKRRKGGDSEGVGSAAADAAVKNVIKVMDDAFEEDEKARQSKRPATQKLKMLKYVESTLKNVTLHEYLIDQNIFQPLARWLTPDPATGILPNVIIRNTLIKIIADSFLKVSLDDIRGSGIGKVLMMLKESKHETRANRALLEKIITSWARPIWGVVEDQKTVPAEQRQEHYSRVSANALRRRSSTDNAPPSVEVKKPGAEGFVMRARVPIVLPRDYAHRPASKISMEEAEAKVDQNTNQLKTMSAAFKDKMSRLKAGKQHARGINISGSVSGGKN